MNITEELRKMQSYGFSRKEAIENLRAKGVPQNMIDRNIDLCFKPITDVNRQSFSFGFTIFLLVVISSTPLIGVFIHDGDNSWLFVSIFLLTATFGFYRLWNFILWFWAIVLGLLAAFLILCVMLILVHPGHGAISVWDFVGVLAFVSMVLGRVSAVMKQRRKFLNEI